MNIKKYWLKYTDKFGTTPLHPQYIMKRYELFAVIDNKQFIKGDLIDLGCGTMPYRDLIKPWLKSYTSLDHPATSNLYPSSDKPDIFADITNIPLPEKKFDTILILQVLEHLSDPQKALAESYRILKKGGAVIISVPFSYPIHDLPHDYYRYTEFALRNIIKESGFKIVKIHPQGEFWESWLLSLVMYLLMRIKDVAKSKKNFFFPIYILLLTFITIPIILLINTAIVIFNLLRIKLGNFRTYSPINYVVVAKRIK